MEFYRLNCACEIRQVLELSAAKIVLFLLLSLSLGTKFTHSHAGANNNVIETSNEKKIILNYKLIYILLESLRERRWTNRWSAHNRKSELKTAGVSAAPLFFFLRTAKLIFIRYSLFYLCSLDGFACNGPRSRYDCVMCSSNLRRTCLNETWMRTKNMNRNILDGFREGNNNRRKRAIAQCLSTTISNNIMEQVLASLLVCSGRAGLAAFRTLWKNAISELIRINSQGRRPSSISIDPEICYCANCPVFFFNVKNVLVFNLNLMMFQFIITSSN